MDIILDRDHQVGLPSRPQQQQPPRDVVVKFHYFQDKESVLPKSQDDAHGIFSKPPLSGLPGLIADYSTTSGNLSPVTAKLSDLNIRYRWLYPKGLSFKWDNKRHTFTDVASAARLLSFDLPNAGVPGASGEDRPPCGPGP